MGILRVPRATVGHCRVSRTRGSAAAHGRPLVATTLPPPPLSPPPPPPPPRLPQCSRSVVSAPVEAVATRWRRRSSRPWRVSGGAAEGSGCSALLPLPPRPRGAGPRARGGCGAEGAGAGTAAGREGREREQPREPRPDRGVGATRPNSLGEEAWWRGGPVDRNSRGNRCPGSRGGGQRDRNSGGEKAPGGSTGTRTAGEDWPSGKGAFRTRQLQPQAGAGGFSLEGTAAWVGPPKLGKARRRRPQ